MLKPVFVSITADDCGPCSNYKRTLETELINNTLLEPSKHWNDLLTVYRINVERRDMSLIRDLISKKGLNPELENYIMAYPTFMLFTPASWINTSSKLEGEVFGAITTRVNGKITLNNNPSQPFNLTIDAITIWLTGLLNQDRFKAINKPSTGPKITHILPENNNNNLSPMIPPKSVPWVNQITADVSKIVIPKGIKPTAGFKLGRPEGV